MTDRILLDHSIAGLAHHVSVEDLRGLAEGDSLRLTREPENKFDANAVRIDHDGKKLGYVPATYSQIVAGLLDAGVTLHAEVSDTIMPKKALAHFRLVLVSA